MCLTNLIDIIYSDESLRPELNAIMKKIKLEEFIKSHNDINNQFVFVVSKNIIYNKNYKKLKLEFHNINENNINNSLITNTLEKLQSIINESLDEDIELSDNNDDLYHLIENNINELEASTDITVDGNDLDSETESDTMDVDDDLNYEEDNLEIPMEVKDNIKMILSKTVCLQLHLFHRKYDSDSVKYITTFLLNDKIPVDNNLNNKREDLGKFNEDEIDSIQKYSNLNYYYEKVYRDYNDLTNIYDFVEHYNIIDNNLISNLNNILSGFYFNYNDIRFQLLFKMLILTHIGNYGDFSKFISYKNYTKDISINNYFDFKNDYKLTIFDNLMVDNLKIWCDICNSKIALKNDDNYYHNDKAGDLCNSCYESKKLRFYEHIRYIKKRILLIGKVEVFKKEVIKTRKFLKKRKYKIKKKNYYDLLEKMNKNLIENTNSSENICKICYNPLRDDIYVGSKCGHCFHRQCIECCDKCQICREETDFIKLYL